MQTLSVSPQGQVTLREELLLHLGVRAGETLNAQLLSDGRIVLQVTKPAGSVDTLFGLLHGKSDVVATIDEMDRAISSGWAGTR